MKKKKNKKPQPSTRRFATLTLIPNNKELEMPTEDFVFAKEEVDANEK